MKFIRYGKYVGEPADAIDLEELIKRLGDFFLQSGFESQFYGVSQMDPERSMEAHREANSATRRNASPKRALKSRTRRSIFWDSRPCRICSARWAAAASAGTILATSPRVSNLVASHVLTNLGTRSTWISAPRSSTR